MSAKRAMGLGRIAPAIAALAAASGVSACADFARVTGITPTPLDTTSPVAAQVATAIKTNYPLPSFRDVPAKPNNVPPASAYKTAVNTETRARDQLDTWVAANPSINPADPAATEAYAASQRARIPAGEMVPPAPAGSEEYAARLRALATPPPPPK